MRMNFRLKAEATKLLTKLRTCGFRFRRKVIDV